MALAGRTAAVFGIVSERSIGWAVATVRLERAAIGLRDHHRHALAARDAIRAEAGAGSAAAGAPPGPSNPWLV